jgi:hypothetical protein
MKYSIVLMIMLLGLVPGCTQTTEERADEVINLPVTFVEGFGPFGSDYASASPEYSLDDPNGGPWAKTYKPLTGIPQQWKNVTKSQIVINTRQFVFQNFRQGKIDSDFYTSLQKSWKWTPDEKRLSPKPIRCCIYIISGTDQAGKFLKKNPIPWPQIFSDRTNRLIEAYNIQGYPSTFLIRPDGTIVGKNLHGDQLEAEMRKIGALK